MRILVGCEMTYEFPQVTPIITMLNVHSSRVSDLERPDNLVTTPSVPITGYRDVFGNWCNRLVAPAGKITLRTNTVVRDDGQWDEYVQQAEQFTIQKLPSDTLQFLLGSRYCETDRLTETAWKLFSKTPLGAPRVKAICDYVHDHITFGYEHSRPTRTAFEAFEEKRGVCLDGSVSGRAVAPVRSAQQRPAHRQNPDRLRSRCRRRAFNADVRAERTEGFPGHHRGSAGDLSQRLISLATHARYAP